VSGHNFPEKVLRPGAPGGLRPPPSGSHGTSA